MSKVYGFEDANKAFAELGDKLAKKIARAATKKAAEPVLRTTERLAPRVTGTLAASLRIKTSFRRKQKAIIARVQVGNKDFVGDAFYAPFVIYGVDGRIEPNDFMERSLEMMKNKALDIMAKETAEGIVKEAKKLHKKRMKPPI